MKWLFPFVLLLWVAAPGRGEGEQPAGAELAAAARVDVEILSIDPKKAIEVVPRLRDTATFPEACRELEAMVRSGHAELLGWPVLWCRNLRNSRTSSRDEVRASFEYAPPGLPNLMTIYEPPYTPTWNTTPNG